ncbi:hypothetical protein [Tenacibaculum maritimum]|uniref:hypothetical protein n=1 Tax=Tenacibaculum maritimum TaxID=107401 RepID=UPI0012E47F72|nr:hypothetical protein [Tenacibaculum maritimum]CAA0186960.1 conserved hypothetical protein [Tenacibaculum maritimum]
MDNKKLSIRPALNLSSTIPIEDFQNRTLRPILKLQHSFILQMAAFFCSKQKVALSNIKEKEYEKVIAGILKKNIPSRNQLIGGIVGHFTVSEFLFYEKHDTEINKRILAMIEKKIRKNQLAIKKIKQTNHDNSTKN